ncbi:MAG: hypothetical protein QOF82_3127 [Frankiales bacterium]|jgi:hypothetical protein|nr:hypothetical protein [Frankiales bacterium]MDX6210501.1 hypothetical protein [Frankiales bacterium]MDX6214040.1 hypothetical protein [Frankiales bacterium]
MKTIVVSAPSAGLTPPVAPISPVGVSWRGYLPPAGATGTLGFSGLTAMTGRAMAGFNCGGHVAPDALHAVAGVVATVPFAAMPFAASTLAASATVAAVAGDKQAATAPKQADKPVVTRNDASPLGNRPGAPPG